MISGKRNFRRESETDVAVEGDLITLAVAYRFLFGFGRRRIFLYLIRKVDIARNFIFFERRAVYSGNRTVFIRNFETDVFSGKVFEFISVYRIGIGKDYIDLYRGRFVLGTLFVDFVYFVDDFGKALVVFDNRGDRRFALFIGRTDLRSVFFGRSYICVFALSEFIF